jgi:hypothetical protein
MNNLFKVMASLYAVAQDFTISEEQYRLFQYLCLEISNLSELLCIQHEIHCARTISTSRLEKMIDAIKMDSVSSSDLYLYIFRNHNMSHNHKPDILCMFLLKNIQSNQSN